MLFKLPGVDRKTFSQKAILLMDPQTPVLVTDQVAYLFSFGKKPDMYTLLNHDHHPSDSPLLLD